MSSSSSSSTSAAAELTEAGAAMRDSAVRVLGLRFRELLERELRRELTPVERAELERLQAVIDTMQSWAVR